MPVIAKNEQHSFEMILQASFILLESGVMVQGCTVLQSL